MQHVGVFHITDNFHSFFCRGDKSYKDALQNIQYFVQTKVLGKICAIPNKQGNCRQNYLDYRMIGNLFKDIALFNYYYMVIKSKRNKIQPSMKTIITYSQPFDDYD